MFDKSHINTYLLRQSGKATNLLTRLRHKKPNTPPPEPAAPPPGMPPPPGIPPAHPGDHDGHGIDEIDGMPSRSVYIHSLLPNTQFFNYNAYAKDCKYDREFFPDLLSTLSAVWKYRWDWVWRQVQPCERIRHWRWEMIERNEIFKYYHYLRLANT